jgi:hypothetical protein
MEAFPRPGDATFTIRYRSSFSLATSSTQAQRDGLSLPSFPAFKRGKPVDKGCADVSWASGGTRRIAAG